MYTIKEAAARTGLSVPVLRAWERRYGVVAPTRTASGYRVYDEAALHRLRSMRRLIDDGWSASAAAAAIVAGNEPADVDRPVEVAIEWDGAFATRLVEAAATLESRGVEDALDEMFASGTFERVAAGQLVPALRALGAAWEGGRLPIAGEHLASNAIQRRLAAAFQAAGTADDHERPVLVGMPPGARHELGALIFATAARRAGLPVVYLGADLPVSEWQAAVERSRARAVVIGALLAADGNAVRSLAAELRARDAELVIAVGGPAAPDPDPAAAARTIRLPDDPGEAVQALRSALRAAATP